MNLCLYVYIRATGKHPNIYVETQIPSELYMLDITSNVTVTLTVVLDIDDVQRNEHRRYQGLQNSTITEVRLNFQVSIFK